MHLDHHFLFTDIDNCNYLWVIGNYEIRSDIPMKRLRQPTVTIRTVFHEGKRSYLVMFAGVGHYHETTRRDAVASKKHLLNYIQSERKKGKIFKRGWE